MPTAGILRGLGVLAWFIALLIFNAASHWSQNADQNGLYIFLNALEYLTTPVNLALSAVVVYGILSIGKTKSNDGAHQTLKKEILSRKALYTASILGGIVTVVVVLALLVPWGSRVGAKRVGKELAQLESQTEKAPLNPHTLDSYEMMSKSKAELGTVEDGLSPETKKRLREGFALQLSGAYQKQNNPVHVDVVGDDHDVLVFKMPSINNTSAEEMIQEFNKNDANFWNGMRLMNYSQVVFSGDDYKRIVPREEFLAYGKDYNSYLARFLEATKELQAGAKGELKKP